MKDKPGVLEFLAKVLGDHNISISSVMQKEHSSKNSHSVPIVMVTHEVREKLVQKALEEIEASDSVTKKCTLLRIKD